jgi:asparagine synthase (glutamine-hydrolysing)
LVSHRGPDGEGYTFFSEGEGNFVLDEQNWSVGLAHKRLSIIDLSALGHQPMVYRDRFWITFNGEIYNYKELRNQLEKLGHVFVSSSDTEVILASYAQWGVDCFRRFRGMWGVILFDPQENKVVISRDRLGIKPLYFVNNEKYIGIASEIKQFSAVPGFAFHMNHPVVKEWLQTGYEYSDKSFFKDVHPVNAGTFQTIDTKNHTISTPVSYWNPEVREEKYSAGEASEVFRQKFEESMRFTLRSDVPVACALSGGLDSSVVALLMGKFDNSGIHTFSTFFHGSRFNERPFIDEVLKHMRAVPHFNSPELPEFATDVKKFIWHNDEPPVAFSPFASFMLAKCIQEQGIKVTLNGQGGDEILGGYWQNYLGYLRGELKGGKILTLLKHFGGSLSREGNAQLLSNAFYYLGRIRNKKQDQIPWRLNGSAPQESFLDRYFQMTHAERKVFELRYLILPKLLKYDDRNTMAFSVEGRYPFLDHELIELCLSFPPDALYKKGWTKMPIRLGFKDVLPEKVQARKSKWGYPVPQRDWVVQSKSYFDKWLSNSARPLWNIVQKKYVTGLLENICKTNGRDTDHEIFVRLYFLDTWMELFQINE